MKLFDLFTEDMIPNWEVFRKTFPDMETCNHSDRWHKEGNPLEHSKLVAEEMYKRIDNKSSEDFLILMSAAMLHDIGKPSTTHWDSQKGDWSCKSHGAEGERRFRKLFYEERIDLREKVAYLIRNHMVLHHILEKSIERQDEEMVRLMNGIVPFEFVSLLNECDMRGSINEANEESFVLKRFSYIKDIQIRVLSNEKHKQWKHLNENSQKVYVMIGIPGSGKTSYANEIVDSYIERGLNIPIISRDTIRVKLGYCKDGEKFLGDKEQEKEVTRVFDEEVRSQVGDFIIDNTSLKEKYRHGYREYARNYGIKPIFIYVEAPSIEDNIARRYGQINENIIRRMWNDLDFPSTSECYELWVVTQRNGETKVDVFKSLY